MGVMPNNPLLRYVGRFDDTNASAPRFDMNGFEIQLRVSGTSRIVMHLSQRLTPNSKKLTSPSLTNNPEGSQPNDFMVFVDGQPQVGVDKACSYCTFDTAGAPNETVQDYVVATGLTAGPHDIRIIKNTEPEWNDEGPSPNWLTFHGLSMDAGKVIPSSTQRRSHHIEFIGDS